MRIEGKSCELDWIRRSIKCRSWSEPITGTAGHSHIHGVSLRNGVRQNLIKVIPAFSPLPPVLCYENVIAKKNSPSEIIWLHCDFHHQNNDHSEFVFVCILSSGVQFHFVTDRETTPKITGTKKLYFITIVCCVAKTIFVRMYSSLIRHFILL